MRELTQEEIDYVFATSRCPLCGNGTMYEGSSGGMSLNLHCNECLGSINLMGPEKWCNLGGQEIKPAKIGTSKPDLRPRAFQCPYGIGYLLNWPIINLLTKIFPSLEERAIAGRYVYGSWTLK